MYSYTLSDSFACHATNASVQLVQLSRFTNYW